MTVTRYRVPWGEFIGTACACTPDAPCLLHYSDLDSRARNQALVRAGVQSSPGR